MIRNNYSVFEDMVTFHLVRKNGEKFDVIIDAEDLSIIDLFDRSICLTWKKNIKAYYAQVSRYIGKIDGKYKTEAFTLQRLITNAKDNEVVDHKDHNTLDNRKRNLRVTVTEKNTKNRSHKNTNNSSGYRNVSWIEGKWFVQLQIKGKNTRLKSFDDVHEAGAYAEEKRKEIYGDFAGKS